MSQAKVDHNKELKKNRKKIVQKQKRSKIYARLCGVVVVLAIIGWIGYSAYGVYEEAHADDPLPVLSADTTAVDEYLSDLEE